MPQALELESVYRVFRHMQGRIQSSYLGMRDLASSGVSGHKLAKEASSNLCSFFCISKLKRKF